MAMRMMVTAFIGLHADKRKN